MPQTANSVHFYIRQGGYLPHFAIHHASTMLDAMGEASDLVPYIVALLPTSVTLEKFEYQNPNGLVLDSTIVEAAGLHGNTFQDMKDCTYISWISGGPKNRSGMFLHPRMSGTYIAGSPTAPWNDLVVDFIAAVVAGGWCDSEGVDISGVYRYGPSRRRRIAVAP